MNKALQILVGLPGILFVLVGIGWIVDPARTAAELGMPLLEGVGRSTQVGDLASFFVTLGACMLIALYTKSRTWYYPAIMLLALAALGRTLAWLVHDAALAIDMIAPEVVIACLLLFASRRLAETG